MLKSFSLSQSRKTMAIFPYIWFLCIFSILKKKLSNLVMSWKAFKQVGEVIFTLLLPTTPTVFAFPVPPLTTSNPEKNNNNKHDMIIFLITEPGNTKENCGICRQMPGAPPVRSAVFVLFFFSPEFCLWLFWLAEAYPHNLTKPQQIPNATTTLCSWGEPRRPDPGWLQTSPAMMQGRRSK